MKKPKSTVFVIVGFVPRDGEKKAEICSFHVIAGVDVLK